jgi:hypothetical protein
MTKILLIALQYASISISGALGLLGLLFNFKDKDSGRLTRWGKIALVCISLSLLVGLISKTIEVYLSIQARETEAKKTREATERTLEILKNLNRVASVAKEIKINASLDASLGVPPLLEFKDIIHKQWGTSSDDQDIDVPALKRLSKNKKWQNIADNLAKPEMVLLVFSESAMLPSCLIEPETDPIYEFSITERPKWIEYPQFGEGFNLRIESKVDGFRTKLQKVMSAADFSNSTVLVYFWPGPIKFVSPSSVDDSMREKQKSYLSSRLVWNVSYLSFEFDGDRVIEAEKVLKKTDKCMQYPYFEVKLQKVF